MMYRRDASQLELSSGEQVTKDQSQTNMFENLFHLKEKEQEQTLKQLEIEISQKRLFYKPIFLFVH